MRRRLFWSLAAAAAALAVLAGAGTFGFFSSSTVNPGNQFTAGRLVLANNKSGSFILAATDMQPGDTFNRTVTLSYDPTSTLDMNYTMQRTSLVDVVPSTVGSFCGTLQIVVDRLDAGQADNNGAAIPAGNIFTGTFSDPGLGAQIALGSLDDSGNSTDTYRFTVTFPETGAAQDNLQGAACTVDFTWRATQQTPNTDLQTFG
jgi:predicted ribosomally synthesized peptide with SipW-like signal peptide